MYVHVFPEFIGAGILCNFCNLELGKLILPEDCSTEERENARKNIQIFFDNDNENDRNQAYKLKERLERFQIAEFITNPDTYTITMKYTPPSLLDFKTHSANMQTLSKYLDGNDSIITDVNFMSRANGYTDLFQYILEHSFHVMLHFYECKKAILERCIEIQSLYTENSRFRERKLLNLANEITESLKLI